MVLFGTTEAVRLQNCSLVEKEH